MTILLYLLLFLLSVVVTLGGCALFTNGIEWLGKRRHVPESAIGSIFAAVGTTLPETSIPIIAIFFGTGQESVEVGLGAILGAPFMLSTLVLPILAGLLLLFASMKKRPAAFKLDYGEIRTDLQFFLAAYGVAGACALTGSKPLHYLAAVFLLLLYVRYTKIKFAGQREGDDEALAPLFCSPRAAVPSYTAIGIQALLGLAGLAGGAHLFVVAARAIAEGLHVSPLLLALLIAPLATELPEMSNSFLWLYQKKDRLAVGNVTGAMVFQGAIPVSVGLLGTDWVLAPSALATMLLAMTAIGLCLTQVVWAGRWRPWLLGSTMLLYLGYVVYLYQDGP